MTAEGLHSKADIADELAYRDMLIQRAEQANRYVDDIAGQALSSLEKANKRIELLREALQALYDEQNGPPLIRDKAYWEAAMAKASKALEESK